MNFPVSWLHGVDLHKLQQIVKWTVYSLLIVNFGFYIWEDLDRAIHTLHSGSTFLDWTEEFATTIDTAAWFVLLLMFELETHALEDRQWKPWVEKAVHGTRIVCFAMFAHTVIAYTNTVIDYAPTVRIEGITELCELADQEQSYVYNLDYAEVTSANCNSLSNKSVFFKVGDNPLVSTQAGLDLERDLAMADLVEAIVWLVIVLSIEIIVRLQARGIVDGRLVSSLKTAKLLGYGVLLILSIYWAGLTHWLYTWDTFLWVAGFAAIEINLNEWRDEMHEEKADSMATTTRPPKSQANHRQPTHNES